MRGESMERIGKSVVLLVGVCGYWSVVSAGVAPTRGALLDDQHDYTPQDDTHAHRDDHTSEDNHIFNALQNNDSNFQDDHNVSKEINVIKNGPTVPLNSPKEHRRTPRTLDTQAGLSALALTSFALFFKYIVYHGLNSYFKDEEERSLQHDFIDMKNIFICLDGEKTLLQCLFNSD
ncbi:hypothetical protein Hamer_G021800 [Homarus americanus]|uniref:Uncharacterized protein n=1 Tax=Homarus americanus TaxID=6706 RepID=A0A8J5K6W7_HOMAM|nr:hypothetical protein Hamer_G021800 [Homarus americanus]